MKTLELIKKKIASVCRDDPAIVSAYLFGSFAKGSPRKSSDLDVAVLLDKDVENRFSLLAFMVAVEKKIGLTADVVILNRADEVLKFEVRKYGKLVFTRSKETTTRFEVMGRKTYEDFIHLHRRYVNAVIYGGSHGQSNPSALEEEK